MKRKLFIGLAGLAIMAVGAIVTVSTVNSNATQSNLLAKSLEALTRNESGNCPYKVMNHCSQWGGGLDFVCTTAEKPDKCTGYYDCTYCD